MKTLLFIIASIHCYAQSSSIDFLMLKKINQTEHPCWDKTMRITSTSIYPALIITPGALLLHGYINHDKIMLRNGIKTSAAIGLNLLLSTTLKYSINRSRPFVSYPNDIIKRTEVAPVATAIRIASVNVALSDALVSICTSRLYFLAFSLKSCSC